MSRAQSSQSKWERVRSEAFRAPWLSAVRERELIALAQAGDRGAMTELCVTHLRLVVQIAAAYQRAWALPEDLVGEGSVGLVEAIRRFDLSKPVRLSTYASWWIRARIRTFCSESRSVVGSPSTRGARVARAQLANAERALYQRLERPPTYAELAAELNVSEVDVTDVAVVYAAHNTSLNDPETARHVEPKDAGPGPEEAVAERESQSILSASLARCLEGLAERDRRIIDAHFLREESSLADLGSQLGVSRQRVSQIVLRLRRTLEKSLGADAC